ncbi:MAG: DegV family protein [Erysipelotrichaceae bacterium]
MNQQKIAVLVDSGMDVPKELLAKEYVFVLPLTVIRDGVEYKDGVTITPEQVYQDLPNHDFKTSLPTIGEITTKLEEIQAQGYKQVLCISISSGLSGTFNAIRLCAQDFEEIEVEMVDTLNIGIAAGLHAAYAIARLEEGATFHELANEVRNKVADGKIFFCVGTLEYLQKGGRIGKVSAILGHALNLKPIITCTPEGIYDTVAKVRGRRQSIHRALDLVQSYAQDAQQVYLAVANCLAEEEAQYVLDELTTRLPNITKVYTTLISPALAVHTGPQLLGIGIYKVA